MKTSYTERNPCRRFGSCVNNACNHKVWTWLDKQEVLAYVNDCLNIVIDKYGELANEVETAKRKSEVDSSSSSQQRQQRPKLTNNSLNVIKACLELSKGYINTNPYKGKHSFQVENYLDIQVKNMKSSDDRSCCNKASYRDHQPKTKVKQIHTV